MVDAVDFESVLRSKRILNDLPTVTERYFDGRYVKEIQGKLAEEYVLFHSNRICVITLAPMHPILTEKKTITSVDFKIGEVSRLQNQVSGKWKRGGQQLKQHSPLCEIHCNDNSVYVVYSCVYGRLVEVNENLLEKPHLLTEKTWSEGYIAVVLPPLGSSDVQKNALK
ncbi:protein Abitram [Centruroides vittatus]|uniref:protein Abitram n=1 Tax=Centruroides vittatus TaxID=120091 RepID=UPI00350E93AE